ncbi:MAG: hypothetical protein V8T86_06875 [Victivallis sp.]
MKKLLACLLLAAASALAARTVTLDYFFQQGCEECARVNALVLPMLAERFPGEYELRRHDLNEEANYLKLIEYQERLNVASDDAVCMIVDGSRYLGGFDAIDRGLPEVMERARRLPAGSASPADAPPDRERLHRRAEAFTIGAILTAGLLDGFNPCVFTTLIFFMSLLSLSRIRGGRLLAVGGVYCLACFCTYVALRLRAVSHPEALFRLSGDAARNRNRADRASAAVCVPLLPGCMAVPPQRQKRRRRAAVAGADQKQDSRRDAKRLEVPLSSGRGFYRRRSGDGARKRLYRAGLSAGAGADVA